MPKESIVALRVKANKYEKLKNCITTYVLILQSINEKRESLYEKEFQFVRQETEAFNRFRQSLHTIDGELNGISED